jgi:DNA-binding GntR family transcriptional regulator
MLKAITQGDAQAASAACRHHLAQTLRALIDGLTAHDFLLGADVQVGMAG